MPLHIRDTPKSQRARATRMALRAAVLIGCVRAATGAMGVRGVRRATVHASASSAAKPAVLWLHGLGDTGAGWQGAFGQLTAGATFHHPTAPTASVTINGGMQSTSWMDLKSFPVDLSEPEAGADFDATVASVHAMLEQIEAEGTPAEQILIGGFSQGGATSLAAGLAYPRRLAGIVSISGDRGQLQPDPHPHPSASPSPTLPNPKP
jgi:predicted esterase